MLYVECCMLSVCPPHTTVPAGGAGPRRRWQGGSRHLVAEWRRGMIFFLSRNLFVARDEAIESMLDL